MKYFSPELRTASIVPRWSVVWTLTRDVVSNHSFFVTLYADQIAELISWYKMPFGTGHRGTLAFMAITHDLDEVATGDLVAPVKKEILDTAKATKYIDRVMEERLPWVTGHTRTIRDYCPSTYTEAKLIIKAADRLDALLFLTVEARLGNGVIVPRIPECEKSFLEAWRALPCHAAELDSLYSVVVQPAIEAHRTTGGYGL